MTRLLHTVVGALSLCAVSLPSQAAPVADAVFRPDNAATVQTVQYRGHYRRSYHRHYSHRSYGHHRAYHRY